MDCQRPIKNDETNMWEVWDDFDCMIDWYCKKSNKMIQGAVEWHEESKINVPDWCEFKNTKL